MKEMKKRRGKGTEGGLTVNDRHRNEEGHRELQKYELNPNCGI